MYLNQKSLYREAMEKGRSSQDVISEMDVLFYVSRSYNWVLVSCGFCCNYIA